MKKLIPISFVLVSLALISCERNNNGEELTILSQVMKPLNYLENGEPKGISVEVVQSIQAELELDQPITFIDNWDSLYNRLKTEDNTAAITVALTAERKEQFKWVGPVTLLHTGFVALTNAGFHISDMDDAKSLERIGVIQSSVTEEILQGLGFANLVEFLNEDALTSALYDGTVDALFDMISLIQTAAEGLGLEPSLFEMQLAFTTTQIYIAFSDDVSSRIVSKWQKTLNSLKDEGALQQITDTYLPGTQAPGRVTLFTEMNPPQNFIDSLGRLRGSSIEMVKAMMEEMNIDDPIICTSWDNAYSQIQFVPNAMTFSTARIESREALYQWVGPVCKKSYVFYVLANSDIHIATPEDAKSLPAVGTVEGWASEEELTSLGFTNVVTGSPTWDVLQKLFDGEVSCIVLNDIGIQWLLNYIGHTADEIRQEATLSSAETYLAFSIDTDKEYIRNWQSAYSAIVKNGKLLEIWNDWFPYVEWE